MKHLLLLWLALLSLPAIAETALLTPQTADEIIATVNSASPIWVPKGVRNCQALPGAVAKGIVKTKLRQDIRIGMRVHFDYDSATIQPRSHGRLNQWALALNQGLQDRVITLVGYTDNRGEADYNQALSERRARAVARYLVEVGGVSAYRLVNAGRGEREPLISGAVSEAEHAQNRRVEVATLGVLCDRS